MPLARNTVQRSLILSTVQAMHNHPTAEEIYQKVTETHPTISKATVYRNLGLLAERGEILRVSHLDAADRYDFECKPHYHFRCRRCDKVFDVQLPYNESLLGEIDGQDDFLFEEYDLIFSGLCPACRKDEDL